MSTKSDLHADARRYISAQLSGMDMASVPLESIARMIDSSFPGGWRGFVYEFEASQTRALRESLRANSNLTPLQKWAKAKRLVGGNQYFWFIREYDEIVSVEITESEVKTLVKRAKVKATTRRDHVTFKMELTVFTRTDEDWSKSSLEVATDEVITHHKFGDLTTAAERADKRDWENMAYRVPAGHPSQVPTK